MTTKQLKDNPAYNGCYQFIASTKYRKNVFLREKMLDRLKEIIKLTIEGLESTEYIETTVAYNVNGK